MQSNVMPNPTPLSTFTVQAVLDAVPWPIWVCRGDGSVDYANEAARQRPGAMTWPQVNEAHLAAAEDAIVVRRGLDDPEPLLLRAKPVVGNHAYQSAWPQAVALLMLESPATPSTALALARIQHDYRLTPSELAVLAEVAQGHTVAEIAARRHVQAVTVRAHLRALFDKTGRRRQAELLRLVVCG